MEIVSFAHFGYEGEIIKVEADLRRGIPAVDLVGLPDGAVREARERMRAAVRNSGFEFPRERILINLSPADLRKEGSSFDLSIALAVLGAANGMLMQEPELRVMVLGELELSGTVRPVKGVLAAVSRGLECGIRHYIVPEENRAEAEIRSEAVPAGVHTLNDAYFALASLLAREAGSSDGRGNSPGSAPAYTVRWRKPADDFSEVRGQQTLVRALQIAAAGGHHLLAYGPPGSGKTLALTRFPALLPLLDSETAVTVTRIHSLAGFPDSGGDSSPLSSWHPGGGQNPHTASSHSGGVSAESDPQNSPSAGNHPGRVQNTQTMCCNPGRVQNTQTMCCNPGEGQNTQTVCGDPGGGQNTHFVSSPPADHGSPWSSLLSDPPFREPHPNASLEGIAGGGRLLRPGEISLAHGGVLFLDEAAQFRASVLQALRAPLETGMVTLSRAGRTARFPARFQLLMAMNPCPCGNYAANNRICTCSPDMVEKYWKKLSAPLLDRIDLRVHVDNPDSTELIAPAQHPAGETTETGVQTANLQAQHPSGGPAETGVHTAILQAQHPAGVAAANMPAQHPAGGTTESGVPAEPGMVAETGVQTTTQLRIAIARAREAQWRRNRRGEKRYEGMEWLNARLGPADIERVCRLSERTSALLSREMRTGSLSGRGGHGILKVARTIADMEGSDEICEEHLAEAVSFRKWGASVPDFLLDV